jgi:hypothetical protein
MNSQFYEDGIGFLGQQLIEDAVFYEVGVLLRDLGWKEGGKGLSEVLDARGRRRRCPTHLGWSAAQSVSTACVRRTCLCRMCGIAAPWRCLLASFRRDQNRDGGRRELVGRGGVGVGCGYFSRYESINFVCDGSPPAPAFFFELERAGASFRVYSAFQPHLIAPAIAAHRPSSVLHLSDAWCSVSYNI